MSGRAVVDTTILFYYVSAQDRVKHELAKRFMERVQKDPYRFVLTFQNLRELTSALVKKTTLSSAKINELTKSCRNFFGDVLHTNQLDLAVAADMARLHNAKFYDSLIISTAARYEISTFYTENVKDFQKIPGISVVNPLV